MGHHLDFHPHIILSKPCHTNTSPDRLVSRHVALEIAHHCFESFVIDRYVIRVHPEHLLPALAAGIFQVQLDVGKCLVDLCVDFSENHSSLGIPATCERVS